MAKKRLKIPAKLEAPTPHEHVLEADWNNAKAPITIDTPHEDPHRALSFKVGKKQRSVVIRADEEGNLYLEFDE